MAASGETSWHGFAEAIFTAARKRGLPLAIQAVEPIPTSDYPTPAQRPLNSRLDKGKLAATFAITMPHWREGLAEAIETYRPEST